MASRSSTRTDYHHGNLVEALLHWSVVLIEEKGVDALSLREVAKRAGVSPAAPFRHFPSKTALLTAVAEQAMGRLTARVMAELDGVGADNPIGELKAVGRGYLMWALENPTHFQVVSSRTLIDFHASERLVAENEAIRQLMLGQIRRAALCGQLKAGVDADGLMVAARAYVYGLARMWIDGHYEEWKIERAPQDVTSDALDLFLKLITTDQPYSA